MSDAGGSKGWGGGLSEEESARLSQHIAGVSASGLPLGPGLRALAEESSRGGFRDALIAIADALDRGASLDEAVQGEARRVPPHVQGLIRAGVRSGDLGDLLNRYSTISAIGAEMRRSFWIGLLYPLLALGLMGCVFVLVDALIVDRFERIYTDFGTPMPMMTKGLLALSHLGRLVWPLIVIVGLAVIVGWGLIGLTTTTAFRNSLLARIPLLGATWRFTSWSEFCHLLAMLIEARVPLPEALRLTGAAVENRDLDLACRAMAGGVERGATLSAAMTGGWLVERVGGAGANPADSRAEAAVLRVVRRAMPIGLPRLLAWAEGRESTAEVLRMAGEMFQSRSHSEASFGGAAVSIVVAMTVIVGVFVVVVGMFMPLVTLVSKLSG